MGSKARKIEHSFYGYREGRIHFFCPLCKEHQSTKIAQNIGWRHHLSLTTLTTAVTYVAYPIFEMKGIFLYFFFWMLLEFGIRTRKRDALICRSCGFDPFLYKLDVRRARNALRKHWQEKIEKENLFAGIKLKNYETKSPQEVPPEQSLVTQAPQLDSVQQRP